MTVAVKQHLLANPAADLPASFNGPVLHILEAYRQLETDHQDLNLKLEEETRCHQADLEKLRLLVMTLSREDSSRPLDEAKVQTNLEDILNRLSKSPNNHDHHGSSKQHLGGQSGCKSAIIDVSFERLHADSFRA